MREVGAMSSERVRAPPTVVSQLQLQLLQGSARACARVGEQAALRVPVCSTPKELCVEKVPAHSCTCDECACPAARLRRGAVAGKGTRRIRMARA